MVSDIIEFRHHKLTFPLLTPEYKVLHGVQQLTAALKNIPSSTVDSQLQGIKALQDTIENWAGDKNHIWKKLTHRVASFQHGDIELQGCQQKHQGRRRLQG